MGSAMPGQLQAIHRDGLEQCSGWIRRAMVETCTSLYCSVGDAVVVKGFIAHCWLVGVLRKH
jgi:hypothetical protein